jgi:hypothetical protein
MKERPGSSEAPEPQRIDANDAADVQYWARKLGVAKEEVAAAVKAAGPSVQDVADHLARRSASGPSS